jgi:uncharacterized protein YndB with AHSA1/START domain
MAQLEVEAEGVTRAGLEQVWRLLEDASTYAQWGPWDASGYESAGDDSPHGVESHGVGAIRWFQYGRTTTVERVLEVEPGRRLVYAIERGIPVHDYRAEVTLTPTPDGTRIRWAATWKRTLLGRIVRHKLRSIYPDVVAHLVVAADAAAARAA